MLTSAEAAAQIGKNKAEAVSKLIKALTAIRRVPECEYMRGERARIRKAIAMLIGDSNAAG